ncbi:tRNA uracil 4-sulfurtransferase ThiI [Anaerobranca gottschalkii]|uniref:Probable tRNA sulfurtransferase n=1 Tax=Anaerobranca gottschalkii DSM 13577 TaxID=1120990 RepID=A0A1I0CM77_9FIRM|nr:tRNA uracil 4-sulfurtransferase ThiI [Anaerobranca gottschalkii]SET20575.1 thiamine biosynthesis protein ThiI [Anaerobranca gottschalkii DSM 13577]
MYDVILVRYGEISLKGKNRNFFVHTLIQRIKENISHLAPRKIESRFGRLYVPVVDNDHQELLEGLRKVFGIVSLSPALRVERDEGKIKEACLKVIDKVIDKDKVKTFKVETRRVDKTFPIKSMELDQILGGTILKAYGNFLKVDIHNPEIELGVEVRKEDVFVYCERIEGFGGLPLGVTGKGLCLLSGGIDSPVAFWLAAKRGIMVEALHFHSYPFTSQRAKQKVEDLCKKLAKYCGKVKLHTVPFTQIQKEIKMKCPDDMLITIMRRFMFRIAERYAQKRKALVLITGENVAQVASQTLESMYVINEVVKIPVIRPLITMDKWEIIEKAKAIDTFETSILPYEDCCTVFVPKNPKTKPTLKQCLKAEENLDVEKLVEEAVENILVEEFTWEF